MFKIYAINDDDDDDDDDVKLFSKYFDPCCHGT